jgi:hypothetical protein
MLTPSPSVLATLSEHHSLSTYSFSQLRSKHLNFPISVLYFCCFLFFSASPLI